MLTDAFYDSSIQIALQYPFDGKLFNTWKLQAKTKVQTDFMHDFFFADNCAFNASTHSVMQVTLDLFSAASKDFGLTINTQKTEVIYQPAPTLPYIEPTVRVGSEKYAGVGKFTYLGSMLSRIVTIN